MISPAINRIAEGKNAEWPLADLVDGRILHANRDRWLR